MSQRAKIVRPNSVKTISYAATGFLLLFSSHAIADDAPSALAVAIAQVQGGSVDGVIAPSLRATKSGFVVRWSREVGDSGEETCNSQYTSAGNLVTVDCTLEYLTHSMGPENSRINVRVKRSYDATGALTKVSGFYMRKRLRDGKKIENRKIVESTDEQLGDLSKPLLRLDSALLP
jgi:predicted nucleic acid-binding Zn ribbon protein